MFLSGIQWLEMLDACLPRDVILAKAQRKAILM
jgi:hypothetical protein